MVDTASSGPWKATRGLLEGRGLLPPFSEVTPGSAVGFSSLCWLFCWDTLEKLEDMIQQRRPLPVTSSSWEWLRQQVGSLVGDVRSGRRTASTQHLCPPLAPSPPLMYSAKLLATSFTPAQLSLVAAFTWQ